MRKKPVILILLAAIHFLYPLYFIFQIIYFHHIAIGDFFQLINVLLNPFQKILFIFLTIFSIILAYGLFKVRLWAYRFFFVFAGSIIMYNATHFFKFSENDLIPLYIDVVVVVSVLMLTFFVINKHIKAPYFNPRLRWWENEDRYKVENLKGTWEILNSKESHYEESIIYDLSIGGMFIKTANIPPLDSFLDISFKITNELIKCRGKVVRHFEERGRYPQGFGLMFTNLAKKDKRKITSFLKILDKKFLR